MNAKQLLPLCILLPGAVAHAAPTLAPAFAPYFEVRTLTTSLPGVAPPGTYIRRRVAFDRNGAFGGRVAVSTNLFGSGPGAIHLVDPASGALTQLGGPDLALPMDVAIPAAGSPFGGRAYFFQQSDLVTPNRRVYSLALGEGGLGTVLSGTGMDAGSGLAFAPASFGPTLGGQLFGSDSGNAPGFTSGDGVRRWDSAGNYTNEVMGPLAANPDSYTDVAFTGPEFGAASNRLVAFNTTGVGGENVLLFSEATLLGNDTLGAYNARQVLAATAVEPASRGTYGAYAGAGYLYGMSQGTVYRYASNGARVPFLTDAPGFNDVEFGAGRTLYVADLGAGLHAVTPSPAAFGDWLERSRCQLLRDAADVVSTWKVGGACPGSKLLCRIATVPACGDTCVSPAQKSTIISAVEAICQSPC